MYDPMLARHATGMWLSAMLVAWGVAVPTARAEEPFSGSLEVNLVNVELWVTDMRGRQITGLTSDDFEVFEDGERVEITHFAEIREGRTVVTPRTGQPEDVARDDAGVAPAPATLVFYFDMLHLAPDKIASVVEDIKLSLDSSIVPAEQVLVVAQTNTVTVVAPLGSSRARIDQALDLVAATGSSSGLSQGEKYQELEFLHDQWELALEVAESMRRGAGNGRMVFGAATDFNELACAHFVMTALPHIEAVSAQRSVTVAATIKHLSQTVSFLGGLPGVKTLVYLSDSLEVIPGTDLFTYATTLCRGNRDFREASLLPDTLADRYLTLTSHASANRVTIYSVQSSGLRFDSGMSADQDSFDLPQGQSSIDFAVRAAEVAGMRVLAAQTGGRAVFNTNAFAKAFDSINGEMASYYSLAFVPLHGGDGKEHRIKVTTTQSGMEVRHRRRYLDKSASARIAERLTTTLRLGVMENLHDVRLGAGQLRAAESSGWLLPLHVILPAERLTYLPREKGNAATLTVFYGNCDVQNRLSTIQQKRYNVPQPAIMDENMLDLVVDVHVGTGVQVLGVAVVDEATNEASYLATNIDVEPPAKS